MAGLDVTGCCRLCLKDASSATSSRIDLQKEKAVATLINELYKVNVKSDRGSNYICVPCYRNATCFKKHLDSYKTKTFIVSTNQKILESQADELLEDSDDESVYCESRIGYRPPISSPVEMLLHLKDCMRSKRFQDALNDQYELGYVLLSGPVYQKAKGTVQDVWHPVQLFCLKCRRKFDDQISFDDHTISCKFKCMFCSRHYTHEETLRLHSCPKRDKHKKSKKRKYKSIATKFTPVIAEERKAVEVEKAEQCKESTVVLPLPNSLPAPSAPPRIEGEASLDAELTNLLERWYGQGEEIEELSHLSVGAIDTPQDNGVFTNSELYTKIIENRLRNESMAPKPAISVKPISELVETPVEQMLPSTVPNMASTYNSPLDVIEIDDDDEMIPTANDPVADKTDQALSEKDILSIVKHFRGIDENESYLVKAKINGTQKLICISKRKNDDGVQSSVVSMVSNSNSALQSGNRSQPQKQIMIGAPTVKQPPIMKTTDSVAQTAFTKPTLIVKNVSDINGGLSPQMATSSRGTQLKISHVQSLVAEQAMTQNSDLNHQQRILNGIPQHNLIGSSVPGTKRIPSASFTVRAATPSYHPGAAMKPAPQRIIVGSNALKFSGGGSRFIPIAPKMNVPSSSKSAQQRIIVQRKQVQTIIKSSTVTRTSSESSIQSTTNSNCMTDINNSLLRSQLQQQPSKMYPSASGSAQNGNRSAGLKALDGLTSATKQFMVKSTTIKRLNN